MKLRPYYNSNHKKLDKVTDSAWKAALDKCREHIVWKLKQRTLFGAHSEANLGTDPIDYYLELAYSKLIEGDWEWKDEYSLVEQMIRIVNSHTSKEVKRTKTKKAESLKIIYTDIEEELYDMEPGEELDEEGEKKYEHKIQMIDDAVSGDLELEMLWDAVKEGKKRAEIAEILEIEPKRFDKLKEKLIDRVRNHKSGGS